MSHQFRSLPFVADVAGLTTWIANLYCVGEARPGAPWVLVDAGLFDCSARIEAAASERFGAGNAPSAIILTHGHCDHVGALESLAERWDVPVYAHPLEMPYLLGRALYPPPDATVGGVTGRFSPFYPRDSADMSGRVQPLPADGTVPGLPDWRWLHTPGHTPGHVSLYRARDGVLLAGDAFVTVRQESAWTVLTQTPQVRRPPAYFTPDWVAARVSLETLAALEPNVVATGHGQPMRGPAMHRQLQNLTRDFEQIGVPSRGRYVDAPAIADETGVLSVPPPISDPVGIAMAASALIAAWVWIRRPGEAEELASEGE